MHAVSIWWNLSRLCSTNAAHVKCIESDGHIAMYFKTIICTRMISVCVETNWPGD